MIEDFIPCPPVLADIMQAKMTNSVAGTRFKTMREVHIAEIEDSMENLEAFRPKVAPDQQFFGVDLELTRDKAFEELEGPQKAKKLAFGEYRDAVLSWESDSAARLECYLRLWHSIEQHNPPRQREYLKRLMSESYAWFGQPLVEPPTREKIPEVAIRLMRNYMLLPRDQRAA